MTTKTKTKTVKKKPGHKPGVPLSAKHREAIAAGRTSEAIRNARRDPEKARASLVEKARGALNAQEMADRIGVSRTTLYDLLEELKWSFGELLEAAGEQPSARVDASLPWWVAVRDETDGTRMIDLASAQVSVPEYECRLAATLLWHEWAVRLAVGTELWVNPIGPILCAVAREGRKIPSDDDLRAAPTHLLTIAAYLAGESLDHPRTHDARLEEVRHMAAFRWTVKLVEVGCVAAARVLARCTRTSPSPEAAHAITVAIGKLVGREDQRRLDEKVGKENNDTKPMNEDVYTVLCGAV